MTSNERNGWRRCAQGPSSGGGGEQLLASEEGLCSVEFCGVFISCGASENSVAVHNFLTFVVFRLPSSWIFFYSFLFLVHLATPAYS